MLHCQAWRFGKGMLGGQIVVRNTGNLQGNIN